MKGVAMDLQTLFNVVGGVLLSVLGWIARTLWDAVADLRRDLHELETDLPKNYVRREDFADSMRRIEALVTRIYDNLDGKEDKAK